MKLIENIWLILFVFWGLPLTYYRSKFRKTVYQTNSWNINVKPVFIKELKALFGNIYPENKKYIKLRNFYRVYLGIYMMLFIVYLIIPVNTNAKNMKKIEVGDKIPIFSLMNQNGEQVHINDFIGKKNLVLFFYPKDDSPGCTAQACSFRDQYEDFVDAEAVVIGISGQTVKSHKNFADKHNLSYTLLSDSGNKIRKQFGVPTNFFGLLPGRVTYIVNKKGEVVHIFNSQVQVTKHVETALQILNNLN